MAEETRVRAGIALFALLALGLCGCALRPADTTPLPGGGNWRALPPGLLGQSLSAVQRVTGQFGERRAVMVFYLEVEGDHLALVGTLPDGSELFSLEQNGAKVAVNRSPLMPAQLRPLAVLADLQLIYWPERALRPALAASGLELADERGDGGLREVRRGPQTLISIHYAARDPWRGAIDFEQRAWSYRYTVETLELERQSAP